MQKHILYQRAAPPEGYMAAAIRLAAAALCGTVSVGVLCGWAWGITALTQILPGLTAMNPMTAVALLVASVTLALHERADQRTVCALSMLVLSIGLAKILELSNFHSFAIDQAIFTTRLDDAIGVPPNRMAPNTAVALVVAAFAIATSKVRSRAAVLTSQVLCCVMIAITLFAIIGYLLGIVALYGIGAFTPMAVHTALGLLLIAVATLSTNPRRGLMRIITDDGPAGQLSRLVLPLVVLVPVVVGILRLKGQSLGYYDTATGVALQIFGNVIATFSLLMVSIVILYRTDVSRRRRELTVRRSEEEFQLAEALGRVGHWRRDLSTKEIQCSAELVRICGLAEGSMPSLKDILALYHPDDSVAQQLCIDRALSNGTGWDESRRIVRPDGEERTIRSHGTAEKDDRGEVVSLFGVFVDITELERSRQKAEAATAAKADFLANMSHEIRTPLNAIIGFTDLILDDDGLSEAHQRQLRLVKNSGDALLTVVNDILDFSKMEIGQIELSFRPFDLAHLAHSASSILRQSAEAKGLVLMVHTSPKLNQYYVGDDSRIRQVLLNLLGNAVKFTQEGSVALTIACIPSEAVDLVTFTVTDTGIGVPVGEENRLFKQFSQANSSISREHGGTGLGLAISKKLVLSMGGEIGFRRGPIGGSEFWCSIPLPRGAETVVARKSDSMTATRAQSILVVEDVAANQELVTAMLSRGGHEVSIASNGREALAVVQRQDFDMILMDVQMPIMDGITATRLIRLLPGKARGVPIIALTANILPEQIAKFRRAGMNDHVGKPINLIELNEAIARITSLGAQANGTDRAPEETINSCFDEKIYHDLTQMLPAERLSVHSATLRLAMSQLRKFEGSNEALRSIAHTMVSQAGMFGFVRLSALCRELENCPAELAPDHIAFALRSAIDRASERLDQLQNDNLVRRSA